MHSWCAIVAKKASTVMELKSGTLDTSEPPRVFYLNGVGFVRRRRDPALWSASSLRLANAATAKEREPHVRVGT